MFSCLAQGNIYYLLINVQNNCHDFYPVPGRSLMPRIVNMNRGRVVHL